MKISKNLIEYRTSRAAKKAKQNVSEIHADLRARDNQYPTHASKREIRTHDKFKVIRFTSSVVHAHT